MPAKQPRKPQTKRPDNDQEQHARFAALSEKVEASDDPKDLERAIKKVAPKKAR